MHIISIIFRLNEYGTKKKIKKMKGRQCRTMVHMVKSRTRVRSTIKSDYFYVGRLLDRIDR